MFTSRKVLPLLSQSGLGAIPPCSPSTLHLMFSVPAACLFSSLGCELFQVQDTLIISLIPNAGQWLAQYRRLELCDLVNV